MSEIKLTIYEVIEHCERVVKNYSRMNIDKEIAERGTESVFVKQYLEHKQVAEWLKELNHLRGAMERIIKRLNQKQEHCLKMYDWSGQTAICDAIEICKEEGGIDVF